MNEREKEGTIQNHVETIKKTLYAQADTHYEAVKKKAAPLFAKKFLDHYEDLFTDSYIVADILEYSDLWDIREESQQKLETILIKETVDVLGEKLFTDLYRDYFKDDEREEYERDELYRLAFFCDLIEHTITLAAEGLWDKIGEEKLVNFIEMGIKKGKKTEVEQWNKIRLHLLFG